MQSICFPATNTAVHHSLLCHDSIISPITKLTRLSPATTRTRAMVTATEPKIPRPSLIVSNEQHVITCRTLTNSKPKCPDQILHDQSSQLSFRRSTRLFETTLSRDLPLSDPTGREPRSVGGGIVSQWGREECADGLL